LVAGFGFGYMHIRLLWFTLGLCWMPHTVGLLVGWTHVVPLGSPFTLTRLDLPLPTLVTLPGYKQVALPLGPGFLGCLVVPLVTHFTFVQLLDSAL